jgi:hypothetical protein
MSRDLSPRHARSFRTTWNAAVDWIEDRGLGRPLGNAVFAVVSAAVIAAVVIFAMDSGTTRSNAPTAEGARRQIEEDEDEQGSIKYLNHTQGFGFTYPEPWNLYESATLTRISNPRGRIEITFGLGATGQLAAGSSRLLDSMTDGLSDRQLIGMKRERIDGAPSLLVSGTGTDAAGRLMRFLAISIRGVPRNYAISIVVPGRSDPSRTLPLLAEIVSSFKILEPSSQTAT